MLAQDATRPAVILLTAPLLGAWLAACESDPGAETRPEEPAAEEPTEAEPPPEPPSLDDIAEPAARSARLANPVWSDADLRWEWELEQRPAVFGTSVGVTQIMLGEDPGEGVALTFYGETLEPGEHEVLPATDETRNEHAGRDSDVFIATVPKPDENALQSESGTVTIERADQDVVVGSFDIVGRSRIRRATAAVRGRFHARRDDYMDALLRHEAAIREQLKRRR